MDVGNKIAIMIIIVCTFIGAFFISTALFDSIAKERGFYTEGQEASASWNE